MTFVTELPYDETLSHLYDPAVVRLRNSTRTRIGQIDTGITRHPALGFSGNAPPENLRIDEGINLVEPGEPPFSPLDAREGFANCLASDKKLGDCLNDFPDHGTKTLSVILSDSDELRGVAPGAQVIPCRIANGPLFNSDEARANMGRAMKHLLDLDTPPRVITISMGNPAHAGLLQILFSVVGSKPGFPQETKDQFQRAYDMGVIVVCAAGQIIEQVIAPARYRTTIGVGGFRKGPKHVRAHYPQEGYDLPQPPFVDVWALADSINRAVSFEDENGNPVYAHSEGDPGSETGDVSGTSYATPQVAAAAALWVETWWDELPAIGSEGAHKCVDWFRLALKNSSSRDRLTFPSGGEGEFPCLNINRLLGRRPGS